MNFLRTAPRFAKFASPRFAAPRAIRFYSNKLTAGSYVANYGQNPTIKYTENHEWIATFPDNKAFIGITKYAADALGDTTFVEVPDTPIDVSKEDSIGSVESVKSASDIYSPVTGTIIAANQQIVEAPNLVNEDPMGEAWFVQIELADAKQTEELMDYETYEAFLKEI